MDGQAVLAEEAVTMAGQAVLVPLQAVDGQAVVAAGQVAQIADGNKSQSHQFIHISKEQENQLNADITKQKRQKKRLPLNIAEHKIIIIITRQTNDKTKDAHG